MSAVRVPMYVITAVEAMRLKNMDLAVAPDQVAQNAAALGLDQVARWVIRHPSEFLRGLKQGFEPKSSTVWLDTDDERLMMSQWRWNLQ